MVVRFLLEPLTLEVGGGGGGGGRGEGEQKQQKGEQR